MEYSLMFVDIIRAWKDPEYRQNLSEADRMVLPAHPAGLIELTAVQLDFIGGGSIGNAIRYYACLVLNTPLVDTPLPKAESHKIEDSCAVEAGYCGENVDGSYMTCN